MKFSFLKNHCPHEGVPRLAATISAKSLAAAMIQIYCPECHRFAQFKRTALLERFGPDQAMPTMLRDMKPCNVGNPLSGPHANCAIGTA